MLKNVMNVSYETFFTFLFFAKTTLMRNTMADKLTIKIKSFLK